MNSKIIIFLLAPFFFGLAGCATNLKTLKIKDPYPRPNIIEMKDNMWVLADPLLVNYYNKYNPKETYSIEVPEGFVMDLASIPIGFRMLAGKYHDLDTAAIVHDYLFWVQPCKNEGNGKRIADKLYRDTLKESEHVSWLNGWIQWILLKTASWKAWDNNQLAKENGESHFMPKKYLSEISKEITWSNIKSECCRNQVQQELVFSDVEFCSIKPENR